MAELSIYVPDGTKCFGCDFMVQTYFEDAMRTPLFKQYCSIFKCYLKDGNKCVGCKACSKASGERREGE